MQKVSRRGIVAGMAAAAAATMLPSFVVAKGSGLPKNGPQINVQAPTRGVYLIDPNENNLLNESFAIPALQAGYGQMASRGGYSYKVYSTNGEQIETQPTISINVKYDGTYQIRKSDLQNCGFLDPSAPITSQATNNPDLSWWYLGGEQAGYRKGAGVQLFLKPGLTGQARFYLQSPVSPTGFLVHEHSYYNPTSQTVGIWDYQSIGDGEMLIELVTLSTSAIGPMMAAM